MSVGYPDYTRVARDGGYLLYGAANVTPPYNIPLFSSYVGNWPYLTLALNVNSTADFIRVVIAYYSDDTFSTIVAFRYAIRAGADFSVTQYANLTEWCQVWYQTISGNPVNFIGFAVYGTSDPSNTNQLVSTDVPEFFYNQSVAASTSLNIAPGHVQPGPATLSMCMDNTAWAVEVQYYDYGSASYLLLTRMSSKIVATGGVWTIGLPDAPLNVFLQNGDAAARFMRISIVSI